MMQGQQRLIPRSGSRYRSNFNRAFFPVTDYTMLRPILVSAFAALASCESSCIMAENGDTCLNAVSGSSMIQHRKITATHHKAPPLVEVDEELKAPALIEEEVEVKSNSTESPQEWTSLVNEKRGMHGACPLEWAAPLASGIKEWVDGLTSLHHADSYHIPPPGGPCGENLAWASNGITPSEAVDMWYNEVNDCATPPPGCQTPKPGTMTGHFTAMVWKGSETMGCAISNDGNYAGCRWKAKDYLSAETPNMAMPGLYEANVGATGEHASGCR